jgi:hypothetical protein
MLAHFIQVPFGLLIRDALITDATPVGKFRRLRRARNCIKFAVGMQLRRHRMSSVRDSSARDLCSDSRTLLNGD